MSVFDEAKRVRRDLDAGLEEVFDKRNLFPVEKPVKAGSKVFIKNGGVIAEIELPGMDRRDIQLEINEKHIEVMAAKKHDFEVKKKHSYSRSMNMSRFYKLIPLPANVDAEKANAEFKNGVLRVTAPLQASGEKSKSKKIAIQ